MKISTLKIWKKFIRWALYVLIGLSISAVLIVWDYRDQERAGFAASSPVPAASTAVTVATVEKGPVTKWIVGEGYAEAIRKAYLQFEEPGKVVFIGHDGDGGLLREGSVVQGPENSGSGQVLARIDSRDKYSEIRRNEASLAEARKNIDVQRAALIQAQVEAADAKRNLERKKSLFEKNYLARSDYDKALNAHKSAIAAVRMAKDRVASAQSRVDSVFASLRKSVRGPEKVTLYAPFTGVVARINVKEGDYFDPSNVVHESKARLLDTAPITLLDPSRMEITLHLPEFVGRQVRTGQRVVVTPAVESWSPGTALQTATQVAASVYSVSPQIDAAKRAIRVKVRLQQQGQDIPDGMYVSCWIAVRQKPDAVRIPLGSLMFRGSNPYVYVEQNGTVSRQNLVLGIKDSKYVEVAEGLFPGDRVVCKGRQKLTQGAAVRVVDSANAMAESAQQGEAGYVR